MDLLKGFLGWARPVPPLAKVGVGATIPIRSYFIIIMPKYYCITLSEAIECLRNDTDIEETDIAIIPSNDAGEVTDGEDIDEDVLESVESGEVATELDMLAPSSDSEQSDSDDKTLASLIPVKPPEKKSGFI
uniref:Uncharacterized protein n=1 Tax=Romanomermis culicivorax TaxID=13658 RepID=A0A915HZC5_ROMCU